MAKKGLSRKDYVRYVEIQLGGDIVNIEADCRIPDIVDMAFGELKHYITDTETMTLPYSQVIDLEGKNVGNIAYIMRGQTTSGPGGFQDVMYIYSRQNALSSYTLTDYARGLMANQNKSALATDLDFHHDKRNEKLYVYAQQSIPSTITLVYTPDYEDVEDIISEFWQNILKRLALAMTKEVLGRIRGKYTLNSATYNLDGDRLLQEAQSELSEIRSYLNDSTDLLLPID